MQRMKPKDPLSVHFKLTPVQGAALRRLGLSTVEELLRHFPARYEMAGTSTQANTLIPGTKVTLVGTLSGLKAKKLWKSRRTVTEGYFEDATGRVKVMWFNQPYMRSYVAENKLVQLTGTVGGKVERPYIANPEVETLQSDATPSGMFAQNESEDPAKLFPVYPETRNITSRWFYHALQRVFASDVLKSIEDPIPPDVRERYHLPDIATALVWMHTPEKHPHAEAARKRFAFEEIFTIQVARAKERAENDSSASFPIKDADALVKRFLSSLEFPPTAAQKRAIADILKDFGEPHPMARLLEGDVGSGKTLVAAASAYAVVNSRPPNRESGTLQVAYMAPTEILAGQHFQSFIEYFKDLPINIALMTGSGCKKFPSKVGARLPAGRQATDISRAQLLKWVAGGEIAMLVGTHALIQKSVKFQHLAFAIVDEQHRFGTRQRRELAQKNTSTPRRHAGRISDEDSVRSEASAAGRNSSRLSTPHFLSMTATPIPRTLALTLYGDLDLSILDELPPGRAKITTTIVKPEGRNAAYDAVRREIMSGRQAFVICPRIEEPDPAKINAVQAKSAKAEAKRLKKDVFPDFEIGLLHGAMPAQGGSALGGKPNKEQVMKDFADGKIQILVATSVVEVGINVPNATVILIEGAERFGLAQLHQLRGRIMRSSHPPHCFLLPETAGEIAMRRLRALEKSDDGFALAEADLEARGAGDLFGRRQWGMSDLGMEALKNIKLIRAAREEAELLVKNDPELSSVPALAERAARATLALHVE